MAGTDAVVKIWTIGPPDTIAPGATLFTEYWFGDFLDMGVCVATAATFPRWKGHLEVTQQGRIGKISGVAEWLIYGTGWSYTVTITNKGAETTYSLVVATLKPLNT